MSVAVPRCADREDQRDLTSASPSAEAAEPVHISRYGRIVSGRRASPKRELGVRTSSAVSVK